MPDTSIAAQVDQLRQTILLLSAMLAALENKPINTYLGVNLAPAQEQWNQMLTEIAARAAPHDWVPWDTGVLASEAGSNTGVPRCWDTHRALLMAAERGDPVVDTRGMDPHVAAQMRIVTGGVPGWPDPDGKAFRVIEWEKKGITAMVDVTRALRDSPDGLAWAACAAVRETVAIPRNADGTIADPARDPVRK